MKNISAWAIRHPLPPVVLFVVLLFMGVVAFVRLPVTADPDVSFPAVYVGVGQPGAAPQELEAQVMQKIEGAVAGIGNIDSITSWAVEGQANMMVQFEIGTPIDRAVADVRDAMAKVRVQLPQGIQEPAVQRVNADGGPMVFYAVSSSALTEEEISGSSTTPSPSGCFRSRASRKCSAAAASTARSASSWILRTCRRSASPPPR